MGIFSDSKADVFATYRVRLQLRDRLMGGTPKDPKIIMGWIKSKMGIDEVEQQKQMTISTMIELGVDKTPQELADLAVDELGKLAEQLALTKNTNGFKIDPEHGLYIEGRIVKAMLKENTNIIFAGTPGWGATRKGPRNAVAEWVFVNPDKIYLDRMAPDGVDLFIGHTSGPKGPTSNLTYYEYVERPKIQFEVMVTKDRVTLDQWVAIWNQAEENGLGSLRSQGFGRFDIELWEPVKQSKLKSVAA